LKAFKKFKNYDFGNVVINSKENSDIEFKFIKLSKAHMLIFLAKSDKSHQTQVIFSQSILAPLEAYSSLRMILNFKYPQYHFQPAIGITIDLDTP
jgi:hypothetical protein